MATHRWAPALLAALLDVWGMVGHAGALTIYRLGGEGYPPPPETRRGEAEFRQLSWSSVDPAAGGRIEAVSVDSAGIAPLHFGRDENIGPGIWQRQGSVLTQGFQGYGVVEEYKLVLDGNVQTVFDAFGREYSEGIVGKTFLIDLGGLFAVDRIRWSPRHGFEDRVVNSYFVMTNVKEVTTEEARSINFMQGVTSLPVYGSAAAYPVQWIQQDMLRALNMPFAVVAYGSENDKPTVEVPLPKVPIRRLVFWVPDQERPWEISELEIFAEGYVPQASYLTNYLDLGAPVSLGWVRWSGRQDPEATVAIRSQVGDDDDPNVYWRKTFRGDEQVSYGASGRSLTRKEYDRLESAERGTITRDADNWELWSAPYVFADSAGMTLPTSRSRRYVQFRVDFSSPSYYGGGRLSYLEFAVSPPLVTDLVGEIDPSSVEPSRSTRFTYVLLPTVEPGDGGFDGLEIQVSGGRFAGAAAVEAVRLAGQAVDFTAEVEEGRAVVHLPRLGLESAGELLEVEFRGEVFRYGATFAGRVFDSTAPQEVWQRVRAGNATEQRDGNRLTVATNTLSGVVLGGVDLGGGVITPNGDGRHEVLQISFDVLKVTTPLPVAIRVWDLAGRQVAQAWEGEASAGRHVQVWDGRDSGGQLVAPGVYVCQIEMQTAQGRQTRSRTLTVAY